MFMLVYQVEDRTRLGLVRYSLTGEDTRGRSDSEEEAESEEYQDGDGNTSNHKPNF